MSLESLIEKLEMLGTIDAKTIGKLRKRIADPDKTTSVNRILTYLVTKGFLSKQDAIDLKNSEQPQAQEKPRYETDDLLVGVIESEVVEEQHGESDEEPDEEPDVVAEFDEADAKLDNIDDPPAGLEEDRVDADIFDDQTIILDQHLPDLPVADEPFHNPMATTWDDSIPTHDTGAASKRLGFEGKLDAGDQWATRWVYIGFGTLGMLLVVGTLLFFVLSLISAEDRFDAATKSFEDGTYGDAIQKFDEFLEKHGTHEKAPIAKVRLAQALLADTYKQKNWDQTIVRAEKQLPALKADESVDLEIIRPDLAVMLPVSALEIAKRATKQESKSDLVRELEKAKKAKALVDNPVYIPNSRRKQATVAKLLDDIEEEIAKGEGLIRKQDEFDSALKQITVFREQGVTDKAFAIYNTLIRSYGDLRANERLQQEMRLVSKMEAQLVTSIEPNIATQSTARPSTIQSSVILAAKTGSPIQSLVGEIVPILADGSVYGIDIGDGSVRWRRFVGFQTNIQPKNTDSEKILIADQSNHDLMLVEAIDGKIVWRNEIGELFLQPQFVENTVFLTTESGKLYRIELSTGNILASAKIPQNAVVPMTLPNRSGLVFQPGFYSNLYVLSAEDMSCQDVFYLGHYRGSISAPPVVWNNFVLIAVNQSGVCDLNVLHPNKENGNLELVQQIRRVTRGIVTNPLVRFGRFMLITSESGDLKILEINSSDEVNPIRTLAEEKFENREGARIYLSTSGSQLWIGAKGISRYKVSRALGNFDRQQILNPDDYFIGPIRKFGDSLVHVRKRSGSALVSVSAVDAESLKQIWRTDLGGPLAGPPIVSADKIAAISSQGDLFIIPSDAATDQFASDEIKSSNIVENLLFDQTVELTSTTLVCLGPPGRPDILYVDIENKSSRLLRLPPPADKAACRPLQMDRDLIIPSRPGQVVRVNPKNGQIIGTPFLPPVVPGTEMKWRQPALVGEGAFVIGADSVMYLIDASDRNLLRKAAELAIEGDLKTSVAASGNLAFGIFESKAGEKLVAIRAETASLAIAASVNLENRSLDGPWAVDDLVLVRLANASLIAFDSQLNQKWSAQIGTESLATQPMIDGGKIKLYFQNGKILTLNPGDGTLESQFDLGQPIVHQPVFTGSRVVFSGLDGTVHSVQAAQ